MRTTGLLSVLKYISKEKRRSDQKIHITKKRVIKVYLIKAGRTKDESVVHPLTALRGNLAGTGVRHSETGLPQAEPGRQPLG